ncbi:putative dihydrolipoyllysine-residue succinyltransferase component [Lasiodiplodia theobromae]|uniref:Dihydrolipoamide acetyltransferase component of pyruvate dehydrogenase complex n=1 Tax=Lasiodiplodia theobromae TaxID=45133 RepID=A0A5N5D9J9_9PEZI|nr:putative dihydrolipoyllysine-residue succinyltransferase component [Lasiodiplodia theobromae]
MAESISEGTLASLLKKIGDRVEVDDEIASIETDKIDVAVNTPEAGVIVEMCVGEGDVVSVDQVVCRIDTGMDIEQKGTGEAESGGSREDKRDLAPAQKAAPVEEVERKNQASQQPDKSTVGATPAAQPSTASLTPQMSAPPTSNLKVPDVPTFVSSPSSPSPASNRPNRTETRVKMTRIRSTIAARLKESQNRAAALTTFNEVDMSALIALRQRHRASVLDAHGVRLGFMGAFAKASALALREVPAVNAAIEGDGVGSTVVWRDYVDISFAVSTEKGLVTPV